MSTDDEATKHSVEKSLMSGKEMGKLLYFVFKRAAETEEFRYACYSLITEIVFIWAKDSGLKRSLGRGIEKSLKRGLLEYKGEQRDAKVADLFEDPEFITVLGKFVPAILDKGLEVANVFVGAIERLPTEEKEQLFESQIHGKDISRAGELVSTVLRIVNDIHGDKPVFYSDKTRVGFRKFIENVDFGELKEVVDGALDDIVQAANGCNDELWQYPAKVVAILSLIPSLLNLSVRLLENSLGRLNEVAPDLLTDILISFVKEVDFKKVGLLVNQLTELTRKIHTGSALLGEAEKPEFSKELERVWSELFATADGELGLRSVSFLKDAERALKKSFLGSIQSDSDLTKKYLQQFYLAPNHNIERLGMKLSMLDELDEEDAAECVENGLSALELQEVAEVVNQACSLTGRIATMKPRLVRATVSQFSQSLDLNELAETTKIVLGQAEQEMEPIFRATLPPVITSICNSLREIPDEFEDEAEQARRALRELLLGGREVES